MSTAIATGVSFSDGVHLLAQLEAEGAISRDTRHPGLQLLNPDMPFEQWMALGNFFGYVKDQTSWMIGDWLLWGAGVYGERYAQAEDSTGLKIGTLMNYVSVCRSIARSRRRHAVPFGVHAEVAPLEPAEQARWLKLAEEHQWTRASLREKLRSERALPRHASPEFSPAWSAQAARKQVSKLHEVLADLVHASPLNLPAARARAERILQRTDPPPPPELRVCPACGVIFDEENPDGRE